MTVRKKQIIFNILILGIVLLSGVFMYFLKPENQNINKNAGFNENIHIQTNTDIKTFR
jgi:CHASE1-domain containing sensor protein